MIKKISVCHGKSCGPADAARLMKTLKDEYESKGIPVEERGCCGRCERSNTIVVLDDTDHETIVSDLVPSKIQEQFIDHPDTAIDRAKKNSAMPLKSWILYSMMIYYEMRGGVSYPWSV